MGRRVLFAWVVIWIAVSVCLGARVASLEYKSADINTKVSFPRGIRGLTALEKSPDAAVLPDSPGEEPLFYRWASPLLDNGCLIAAARSEGSEVRDLLYIDTNSDGSLKDETPVKAYKVTSTYSYFGPVEIQIPYGPQQGPYHLNFVLRNRSTFSLSVRGGAWREGTVAVDGRETRCILVDGNVNGTFNDTGLERTDRDMICFGEGNSLTRYAMARYVKLSGRMYELSVDPQGVNVSLTPAENIPYGKVRVDESVISLGMAGHNGVYTLAPRKGLVDLPVGQYKIDRWQMTVKKGWFTRWKVTASGSSDAGQFSVVEGQETKLALAGPFTATVTARKTGNVYYFNSVLTGGMGEKITLMKNGKRPKPPKLRIRSEDGKLNRAYEFRYG